MLKISWRPARCHPRPQLHISSYEPHRQ